MQLCRRPSGRCYLASVATAAKSELSKDDATAIRDYLIKRANDDKTASAK